MKRPYSVTPQAEAMVAMRRSGLSLEQIGARFGVTRARVWQILAKQELVSGEPLPRQEGGRKPTDKPKKAVAVRHEAFGLRMQQRLKEYVDQHHVSLTRAELGRRVGKRLGRNPFSPATVSAWFKGSVPDVS